MSNCNHPEVEATDLLDRWLEKNHLSVPAFAKMIKRSSSMVHAWRFSRAHPRILDVLAIYEITGIEAKSWTSTTEQRRLRQIKDAWKAKRDAPKISTITNMDEE